MPIIINKINAKLIISALLIFMVTCLIQLNPAHAENQAPAAIKIHVKQFNIIGNSPIPNEETQQFLNEYTNTDYDLATIQTISEALEARIRESGYAFYRVVIPPQNIADGSVDLKIISFQLGEVKINQTLFFDKKNILASIPILQPNASPNTQVLAQQVKVANHHSNKDIAVVFKQSDKPDTINAEIEVTETKPHRFALLSNNFGTKETGKTRITAAFQHTNLWNKDHSANISFTTSPNHSSDVRQYGLSYSMPLYSQSSWLTAYYSASDVDNGRVAITGGDLDVSGSGEMFGLHYLHYLKALGDYQHEIDISFDNRLFSNTANLIISNTNHGDISPDIRSTPLTISYKGNTTFDNIYISHRISWSKNLGIGSFNDTNAYQDMAFSTGQQLSKNWDLFRYEVFANKAINNWSLAATLKGQYANESLISGEQFGIGGAYSVRGYEEREIGSDIGNSVSFEAYTPRWKEMNLLFFYDYGQGKNRNPTANINNSWKIASTGIGWRWQWQSQIQARVDFAHTLKDGTQTRSHQNTIHASISLFY